MTNPNRRYDEERRDEDNRGERSWSGAGRYGEGYGSQRGRGEREDDDDGPQYGGERGRKFDDDRNQARNQRGQSDYGRGGESAFDQDRSQERFGQRGYGQQDYGQRRYQVGQGNYYGQGGQSESDYAQSNQGSGQSTYGQRGSGRGRFGQDVGSGAYGFGQSGGSEGGQGLSGESGQNQDDDARGGWNQGVRRGSEGQRAQGMGAHRGKGPKGYTRSDERIKEDVSDRMTDDAHIDAAEIVIEVSSGEVTLSGTVSDRNQRRRAEDCIEQIPGVKHVQNNLRVKQQSDTSSSQWDSSSGANGQTSSKL